MSCSSAEQSRTRGDRNVARREGGVSESIRRRDRSGHDEQPLHRVRQGRHDRVGRAERARADLSAAGLGRARRDGDLAQHAGSHRRRARARGAARGRSRGRRHHESARDDGALGPQERQAAAQRARVAGHAHGGARREICARRRSGPLPRRDGFAARDLLQRTEAQVAARHGARRARESARGRRAVRHDRQLGAVESHGRPVGRIARHRRHEREPHAAHEPRDARLGRRAARSLHDSARGAAAHRRVERGVRQGVDRPRCTACRSRASSAISRPRSWVRRASRRARRRTPTAPAVSC